MGDGGGGLDQGPGHLPGGNAQAGGTLLGKLLRVNADGSTPTDNPFAAREDGVLDLVWHFGLRNPWRWSFDRLTGVLWYGDVGEGLHEELDFQPAGAGGLNFGWHCMEGIVCTGLDGCTCFAPELTWPIHDYAHGNGDCAIIGGYAYRGPSVPELHGTYFFADYCSARIWSLTWDGVQVSDLHDHTTELAPGLGQSIDHLSS